MLLCSSFWLWIGRIKLGYGNTNISLRCRGIIRLLAPTCDLRKPCQSTEWHRMLITIFYKIHICKMDRSLNDTRLQYLEVKKDHLPEKYAPSWQSEADWSEKSRSIIHSRYITFRGASRNKLRRLILLDVSCFVCLLGLHLLAGCGWSSGYFPWVGISVLWGNVIYIWAH